MPAVPLVMYIRPHGRKAEGVTEQPEAVHAKAMKIIYAGYNFSYEDLGNGMVSITIEGKNVDVDIDVVPNKIEAIQAGYQKLIDRFDFRMAKHLDETSA